MEKFIMIEQLLWHIEFQAYPFRNCTQNNNATEIGELHFFRYILELFNSKSIFVYHGRLQPSGTNIEISEISFPLPAPNQAWWVDTLRYFLIYYNSSPPGLNGRHFADDIFRRIFVNEKYCLLIKILLKFVPKSPIDNNNGDYGKRLSLKLCTCDTVICCDLTHWPLEDVAVILRA